MKTQLERTGQIAQGIVDADAAEAEARAAWLRYVEPWSEQLKAVVRQIEADAEGELWSSSGQ